MDTKVFPSQKYRGWVVTKKVRKKVELELIRVRGVRNAIPGWWA